MMATVQIGIGELADKITILEIKSARIRETEKLTFVRAELLALRDVWQAIGQTKTTEVAALVEALREVNSQLWDLEERVRESDRQGCIEDFQQAARAICLANDRRATFKSAIDQRVGSTFREQKFVWRRRHRGVDMSPHDCADSPDHLIPLGVFARTLRGKNGQVRTVVYNTPAKSVALLEDEAAEVYQRIHRRNGARGCPRLCFQEWRLRRG